MPRSTLKAPAPGTPAMPGAKARAAQALPPPWTIRVLTAEMLRELITQACRTAAYYWTVTPEIAALILDMHDDTVRMRTESCEPVPGDNRKHRPDESAKYSHDMKAGDWRQTGDTVKIDCLASGGAGAPLQILVTDGQHRLRGAILSRRPVQLCLFFGARLEDRIVVDRNLARTLADNARLDGIANAKAYSDVLHWWWRWQHGNRLSRRGIGIQRPGHIELLKWSEEQQGLVEAAAAYAAAAVRSFRYIPASVYGMLWLLLRDADPQVARAFLADISSRAVNLAENDPVVTVQDRMIRGTKNEGKPLTSAERLALLVKAYNARVAGLTPSVIELPRGGLTPDNFPEPKKNKK